jgi:phosphohistidine phosphatase
MKTLYVVRHAKSSWDNPLLDDFSRPLSKRGERDAPHMAKRLKEKRVVLDLVLTSPAHRTFATAKQMAEVLGYAESKIKTNPGLYHASDSSMLDILKSTDDKYDTVMVVGHNPGLTDFVNALMNQAINNVPTCGIAACQLNIQSWGELTWKQGKLLFYDYPKSAASTR